MSVFERNDFDTHAYLSQSIAGGPARIAADLRVVSAQLESTTAQLKSAVAGSHDALLAQISSLHAVESVIHSVDHALTDLAAAAKRMDAAAQPPYQTLTTRHRQLANLNTTAVLLRRVVRVVQLGARLPPAHTLDVVDELGLVDAALTSRDMERVLMEGPEMGGIQAVDALVPNVVAVRKQVLARAEEMLEQGLSSSSSNTSSSNNSSSNSSKSAMIGTALLVYHVYGNLGRVVRERLNQAVREVSSGLPNAPDIIVYLESSVASRVTRMGRMGTVLRQKRDPQARIVLWDALGLEGSLVQHVLDAVWNALSSSSSSSSASPSASAGISSPSRGTSQSSQHSQLVLQYPRVLAAISALVAPYSLPLPQSLLQPLEDGYLHSLTASLTSGSSSSFLASFDFASLFSSLLPFPALCTRVAQAVVQVHVHHLSLLPPPPSSLSPDDPRSLQLVMKPLSDLRSATDRLREAARACAACPPASAVLRDLNWLRECERAQLRSLMSAVHRALATTVPHTQRVEQRAAALSASLAPVAALRNGAYMEMMRDVVGKVAVRYMRAVAIRIAAGGSGATAAAEAHWEGELARMQLALAMLAPTDKVDAELRAFRVKMIDLRSGSTGESLPVDGLRQSLVMQLTHGRSTKLTEAQERQWLDWADDHSEEDICKRIEAEFV